MVPPQRLDQVRALDRRVAVARGLSRPLPNRLDVQSRAQAVAEHPVNLRPAVGAVRESGQQREPDSVQIPARLRVGDALEDPEAAWGRGGLLLGQHARGPRVVRDPLPACEPLRRRHQRRHAALLPSIEPPHNKWTLSTISKFVDAVHFVILPG